MGETRHYFLDDIFPKFQGVFQVCLWLYFAIQGLSGHQSCTKSNKSETPHFFSSLGKQTMFQDFQKHPALIWLALAEILQFISSVGQKGSASLAVRPLPPRVTSGKIGSSGACYVFFSHFVSKPTYSPPPRTPPPQGVPPPLYFMVLKNPQKP